MAAPRSSYTQAELRDLVRGDLGLRSNNLLTDADINSWGYQAQSRIARQTRWLRVTGALQGTTADQAEYDLPNVAGVGKAITIEEVRHNTLPLRLTSTDELMMGNYYWRRDPSGTPLYWYPRGGTVFGLYPAPASTDATALQVIWTGIPPKPTGDSDFYYVPYSGEDAILAFCKWRAAVKDASGEGAHRMQELRAEWLQLLQEVKSEVEAAAYGEVAIMGGDGDVRSLRPWGFDPMHVIAGP